MPKRVIVVRDYRRRRTITHTIKYKDKPTNVPLLPITKNHYEIVDDQVRCNRRVCPKCESGCLMANHGDRHYCGKCHTVVIVKQL